MTSFFGLSSSKAGLHGSNSKNSHNHFIESSHSYIQPEDDDILARQEIDHQRTKWKAFMKSRGNIWSEKWLWQNWKMHAELASDFVLKRKLQKLFDSKVKTRKKLKKLIRNGVPPEYRGLVWWACSGAEDKKNSSHSDRQYLVMVQRSKELEHSQISHDIDKDLKRTFPDIMKSNTKYDIHDSLRRVLLAFAVRNNSIGYCQSMNYICGLLLFHMDEEHSFWVLSALIEDILPLNYYNATLIGARIDQQVFQSCIAWKLPRLHAVFKATDTLLEPILCPWFLCLYINVLPLYSVCRVWDCLFWEGNTVLFRIGLTMLTSKAKYILHAKDFLSIYGILKSQNSAHGSTSFSSFQLESPSHSDDTRDRTNTTTSAVTTTTTSDSSTPATLGATVSDTGHLINSAFGFKWIKFVPIEQIENLRRKFAEIMDTELQVATANSLMADTTVTPTATKKKAYRMFFHGNSRMNDKKGKLVSHSNSNDSLDSTAMQSSSLDSPSTAAATSDLAGELQESEGGSGAAGGGKKRRNMSILIQSILQETDVNNLRQLALQMDEGLGSEVEKFAKEMHEQGSANTSTGTSHKNSSLGMSKDSHKHSHDDGDDDDDDEQEDDDEEEDEEEEGDHVDDAIGYHDEEDNKGIV